MRMICSTGIPFSFDISFTMSDIPWAAAGCIAARVADRPLPLNAFPNVTAECLFSYRFGSARGRCSTARGGLTLASLLRNGCFAPSHAAFRLGRGRVKAIHVQSSQLPVDAIKLVFHDISHLLRRTDGAQVQEQFVL